MNIFVGLKCLKGHDIVGLSDALYLPEGRGENISLDMES